MPQVETPAFLEAPEAAWIRCESYTALPNEEVACAVLRVYGDERVVITPARYFDEERQALQGAVIANVEKGHLVDFPSGDRLAVPDSLVTKRNGSTV